MTKVIVAIVGLMLVWDFFTRVWFLVPDPEPVAPKIELQAPGAGAQKTLDAALVEGLFGVYVEEKKPEPEPEPKVEEQAEDVVSLDDATVRIIMIAQSGPERYKVLIETRAAKGEPSVYENVQLNQTILGYRVEEITSDSITFAKGNRRITATMFKKSKKDVTR